ncbi:putative DNA-binding transcriptional regulator YafY [Orenia metallireducens]|uniref:Predicted DNA-binding transcriptional regulator YafY, contains an HTH and WYL domains n=1 Tax=Orenia metallireducens TaxID=1413210 RepID=A0A285I1V4_9FIRM|nr:WYL domain-containing protein [Orenia metallireducens]PRX23231.1 putative DNA-binding transcriptional regulator YafY [Orenia metallireducens]SNY41934.1 Predicted DNA-binding transcriptional regulator YafY, contains an HTH and WYL domains [Orenia metallireducens]
MSIINRGDSSKPLRLLSIFERLNQGKILNKAEEAERFSVDKKTIQRDIKEIRNYFVGAYNYNDKIKLIYDRKKKGYRLKREDSSWLTQKEILAISKVLLESRSFNEAEMNQLLDKLILQAEPEERKHITEVIKSERFYYNPLEHGKDLFEVIWDFSKAVREKKVVEVDYIKATSSEVKKRCLKPVGVIFSEFYFYLIAYICDSDLDFPIVYRLDRIQNYEIKAERFRIPYVKDFKEGEFRKRVQFMYTGKLMNIKFKFWGRSIEAILDRLPTAEIVAQEDDKYIVKAEVYGEGIKMWLLSQAEYLEVIEPLSFRKEMKETVEKMMGNYN